MEARTWVERALSISAELSGDGRARLQVELGIFLSLMDNMARAGQLLDEGLSILRETGDGLAVALVLIWQGAVANFLGDHDRAEPLLEEALGLAKAFEDPAIAASMTARALANLGSAAHGRGDLDLAVVRYELALQICREHGYLLGAVRTLCDLGDMARDQGDYARALECYRECFSLMGSEIDQRIAVRVLEGAALAGAAWNAPEQAARLLGAADALTKRLGMPIPSETGLAMHQRTVEAISSALEKRRFDEAWSRGRRMSLDQAIAEVLAMAPPQVASERRDDHPATRLSRRENEVLQLLVAGYSDREIAEALSISVRTVEGHVTHVRAKLGVQTRTAAVALAITSGLVDPASLTQN
jgi:non-specific serine/threonine protein kinase